MGKVTAEAHARYNNSEKGKARRARYNQTEKAKAQRRRYRTTAKRLASDREAKRLVYARRKAEGLCVKCGDQALTEALCWACLSAKQDRL